MYYLDNISRMNAGLGALKDTHRLLVNEAKQARLYFENIKTKWFQASWIIFYYRGNHRKLDFILEKIN